MYVACVPTLRMCFSCTFVRICAGAITYVFMSFMGVHVLYGCEWGGGVQCAAMACGQG